MKILKIGFFMATGMVIFSIGMSYLPVITEAAIQVYSSPILYGNIAFRMEHPWITELIIAFQWVIRASPVVIYLAVLTGWSCYFMIKGFSVWFNREVIEE